MREAARLDAALVALEHDVVAAVVVAAERAAPLGEEGGRVLRPAPSAELVHDARPVVVLARRIGPDVGAGRLAGTGVQHLHRRLVGVQHGGVQHGGAQHEGAVRFVQGLQAARGRAGPGRQRRARRVHARARVDLLLPVVGQVIDVARHQRVGEQARVGHALVDDLRLGGLLLQGLAALAGPLPVDMPMHDELRGHDVQPLAHVFADALHRLAAGAARARGLVVVLDAAQILGQPGAALASL